MSDKLNLTMLSGSFEYDSEDSLTILRDYLKHHSPQITSELIIYRNEDDNPSLQSLEEKTDVLLVFTRRLNTEGIELERFKNYCAQGKPIIGVRTASHAYQNWLAFDKEVLGGNYDGHYGNDLIAHVELVDHSDHPILKGVEPFESQGSLYRNTPITDDTMLLLTGRTDEESEPIAWTRVHSTGDRSRIFYTSLGHQRDFWELDFLRLIDNAINWVVDY
mgnify:CR=1 FL=1